MLEQEPDDPLHAPLRQGGVAVVAAESARAAWVAAQLGRLQLLLASPVDRAALARLVLHELAPLVGAAQGAAYVLGRGAGELLLAAGYAAGAELPARIAVGEGLLGQCAAEQRKIVVRGVPEAHFRVQSALGSSAPAVLAFVPVWLDAEALAVLELGWLGASEPAGEVLLDRLVALAARRASRAADPSSAGLDAVSLGAAGLDAAGPGPAAGAAAGPRANAEARRPCPSAGRQGFWSTLSHELRSPLNSVIVLSHVLSENAERNLTEKQVSLARVIHGSGKELLALVDSVALMAKIEARRLVLVPGQLELAALRRQLLRALRSQAAARGVSLAIELEPGAPDSLPTDAARVRQILEYLLSAAIERAEGGAVSLSVGVRGAREPAGDAGSLGAGAALAFVVRARPHGAGGDAGARQAEPEPGALVHDELELAGPRLSALARGGGLGLEIGRELAVLLGGELREEPGGADCTLLLPVSGGELAVPAPLDAGSGAASPTGAAAPPREPERSSGAGVASPADPLDGLDGLEILLVDPDVRQAFTLTGQLERQGAAVAHADELREAVERLAGRRAPGAVIIDARLLGSGPEAAAQRLLRLAEHIPLVVLREAGDGAISLPHVHHLPRSAAPGEVVALLRRVALPGRSLQTRVR